MEFEQQIFYSPDDAGSSGNRPTYDGQSVDFYKWAESAHPEDIFVNWLRHPSYTVRTNIAEKFSRDTWTKMTEKVMEDEIWTTQPSWKKALADYVYYVPLDTPQTATFFRKAFNDKEATSEITKTRMASLALDDQFFDRTFETQAKNYLIIQSDKVKWRPNDSPAILADKWMTMQLINVPMQKYPREMITNRFEEKRNRIIHEWAKLVKNAVTDTKSLTYWWHVIGEIVKSDDPFYISRIIVEDLHSAVYGKKHKLTMGSNDVYPTTLRILNSSDPNHQVSSAFRNTMSEIFLHDSTGHDLILTPAIQLTYSRGETRAAENLFETMHASRGLEAPANRNEILKSFAEAGDHAQIIWVYYPPSSKNMCYLIIDNRVDNPDQHGSKSSISIARYKEKETGYDLPGAGVADLNCRRSADALAISMGIENAYKDYEKAKTAIENNLLTDCSPENITTINNFITALEWVATNENSYPDDAIKYTTKIMERLRAWMPNNPQILMQYFALAHAAPFYSLEEHHGEYFVPLFHLVNNSLIPPQESAEKLENLKPISLADFAAEIQRLNRVHLSSINIERIKSFASAYLEALDKQLDEITSNPHVLGLPNTFFALINTVAPLNTQIGWRNFENPDDVFSQQFHAVRKKALDILVESELAINARTGYSNILQSLITEWTSLSHKNQETIINLGLLKPNGIFRYHWAQMIGNMNQPEIFPFIRDTLIPWALRQKEAELLLGGILQGKFPIPPGLSVDAPSAVPLSPEAVSRGIVESIISIWLQLDKQTKEMVVAHIFDTEGALHNHFAKFARNLENNYDYLIYTLLPLMQKDEDAGSMLHFILAYSPHPLIATQDQITAKEMVIEAALFTGNLPTYPHLANFHEFVGQLNASDKHVGMSGNIPVIIRSTDPDFFPSHFPVAFDEKHGEIVYWGELVDNTQDSKYFPPFERIHRSILRGLEQHPAAESWLQAIDSHQEDKFAQSITQAMAKKLISPPKQTTPIRLPLLDPVSTTVRSNVFPRINLFEVNEDRTAGEIGLGGIIHFTPDNRIGFTFTTSGVRFSDIPTIPSNFSISWTNDMDRVRKAVLQKTFEEFSSGERERKHLNLALRRMSHKKHIVGSRRRDDKPIRDYSRPGEVDFENMMQRLEEHYGFMASTDKWITKNMGIFITRGHWNSWKDAVCDDVLNDGMTDELEWIDKQMKTLGVNEIWIGRPVNLDDQNEVSFDNRKIQTIPDEKFREIPNLLDIILDKKNWIKQPGIQFLSLSKRPLRANVIRARKMTYNAYKIVIFSRDPDTGILYDPPRTRYATFRAPIFNDYVLKLLGWTNAKDDEDFEPTENQASLDAPNTIEEK